MASQLWSLKLKLHQLHLSAYPSSHQFSQVWAMPILLGPHSQDWLSAGKYRAKRGRRGTSFYSSPLLATTREVAFH